MNHTLFLQLLLFAVAPLDVLIASYVLWRNPRANVNRAFFLFVLGAAIWASGIALLSSSAFFLFDKVIFYGGTLMVFGLFAFAKVFPEGAPPGRAFWFSCTPFLIIAALIPFGVFITSTQVVGGKLYPTNGPLFPLYVVVIGGYLLASFSLLIWHYRRSKGLARLQMRYLFFGALIFMAVAFVSDVLMPALGVFGANLLGPAASIVFVGATAYAIVRHQLMDIRVVIQRGLLYAVTISITTALYFFLIFALDIEYSRATYHTSLAGGVIAALIVVLGFPAFKKFFQRVTDPLFFKGEYDYHQTLRTAGEVLRSTIDLYAMTASLDELLRKTLKTSRTVFLLENPDGHFMPIHGISAGDPTKEDSLRLLKEISPSIGRDVIVCETLAGEESDFPVRQRLVTVCRDLDIAIIVPLFCRDRVNAVLLLGKKLSGDPFVQKDIDLLHILSRQIGVALENARLYEEVKRHNKDLEAKVKERMGEIRQLYENQSKFLTDITHELQTPLAILKGNTELLEKDLAQGHKSEQTLHIVQQTLDRMSKLITHLLQLARVDLGEKTFPKEPLFLDVLVREVSEDCLVLAQHAQVQLSCIISPRPLPISGNKNRLRQLFLNLISNAFKHTPPGGTVTLETGSSGDDAWVTVKDTGEGIASEDIPRIFDRFYRADVQEGIGLGLAICKQIVERHGGSIAVESRVGDGATFTVRLPLDLN